MPADQLDMSNAPPKRHEVLKPDFQVQPQPTILAAKLEHVQHDKDDKQGTVEDAAAQRSCKSAGPKSIHRTNRKVEVRNRRKSQGESNDQPQDRECAPRQVSRRITTTSRKTIQRISLRVTQRKKTRTKNQRGHECSA